jgi:type IV pilus assembly protein PilP
VVRARKMLLRRSLVLTLSWIVFGALAMSPPKADAQTAADPAAAATPAPAAGASEPVSAAEAAKQLEALTDELFLQGMMDAFEYDPRGRRDPFVQPVLDRPVPMGAKHGPFLALQRFDINTLKLVGIIWDVKRPRAMITDPGGKIHIVGPNAKIGPRNGYIAVIREGEIVVVETVEGEGGRLASSAQVIKLAK